MSFSENTLFQEMKAEMNGRPILYVRFLNGAKAYVSQGSNCDDLDLWSRIGDQYESCNLLRPDTNSMGRASNWTGQSQNAWRQVHGDRREEVIRNFNIAKKIPESFAIILNKDGTATYYRVKPNRKLEEGDVTISVVE